MEFHPNIANILILCLFHACLYFCIFLYRFQCNDFYTIVRILINVRNIKIVILIHFLNIDKINNLKREKKIKNTYP